MKFAAYFEGGVPRVGQVDAAGEQVQALDLSAEQAEAGVLSLVLLQAKGLPLPGVIGSPVPLTQVKWRAPLPHPRRNLFCVGRNYHAHAKELAGSVFRNSNQQTEGWPIVFTKVPETVIAHQETVRLPHGISEQIDYEAELAIVIGRAGRNIPREQALSHIWGYTLVNDVTARDVQMRHQQWDLGKSFDTFCPMGPWVVTADALDAMHTRIRGWVNGELRQDARTEDMMFDIPSLIETCSRGITLLPGDIIATGTPAGVGMGMTPPTYLRRGDRVRVEVDGLGVLENPFD